MPRPGCQCAALEADLETTDAARTVGHQGVESSPTVLELPLISSRRSTLIAGLLLCTSLIAGLLFSPSAAGAQDPAAQRLFDEGQRLYNSGDSAGARAELELVARQFPNDALAPKALLRLVQLFRDQNEDQEAKSSLNKLLENYPRSEEAATGFLIQGETLVEKARSLSDLDKARATFRRVPLLFGIDQYPELKARSRARIRGAELALLAGDVNDAEAQLVAVVEDEPASSYSGRARLLLGRTLLLKSDLNHAMEILQRLAEDETATEGDRSSARHLLSLAHRHRLRPQNGQDHWLKAGRFPASGLELRDAVGVAAADDGRVLLVDRKDGQVIMLDGDGSVMSRRNLKGAQRPGWAGDVPLLVASEEVVLPFDNRRMTFLEPKAGKERPLRGLRAAVRGPFGDWFMIAKGWKSVLSYQSPRQGQELSIRDRTEFIDLERDTAGQVYALDARNKKVTRIALDRKTQKTIVQGDWRRAAALAVDPLDQIYVLDRGERKIHLFNSEGRLLTSVGPTLGNGIELRDPRDIGVDGSGRLFIADAKLPFLVLLD